MLQLNKVHHTAIICSDYQNQKTFYTEILGLEVLQEIYREERDSYKLDLALNGNYIVELFSFLILLKDLLVLKAAVCDI
jgi:glyoxylase I family protein